VRFKDTVKLTPEKTDGFEKYRQAKEKKKVYQREWMATKRKNDPEYYAKQKAYNAHRKKEQYATDEEFRAKEREYYKKYILEKIITKLCMKNLWQNKKASFPRISFFYHKLFANK